MAQDLGRMNAQLESDIDYLAPRNSSSSHKPFAGSFTPSIYDTAWVACIRKNGRWLFPKCFDYILRNQLTTGLWHPGYSTSDVLNGLGGLFALLEHFEDDSYSDIHIRVTRAEISLSKALQLWKVDSADGVGFEIILPAMLDLLASKGLVFEFPGKEALLNLREARLFRVPLDVIYTRGGPILHSVEAFYLSKEFDYSQLRKHKIQGSMMGSPAASAAYLMRSSPWDNDTQLYLERVLDNGLDGNTDNVPSAYPTCTFELTWAMTTLSAQNRTASQLPAGLIEQLLINLRETGASSGSCVGFMPGVEPDLDDTAKSSIALGFLGLPGLSRAMMETFENGTHCKTYAGERNASPTANCNALHAMISDAPQWIGHKNLWCEKVLMLLKYLTLVHWDSYNVPSDKWNHSPWYSLMLLAQGFSTVMTTMTPDAVVSTASFDDSLKEEMVLLLSRFLVKALSAQSAEGAWGEIGQFEETAYVLLLLVSIQQTDMFLEMTSVVEQAIEKGREFLKPLSKDFRPEPLWIEKVNYGSALVSRAYISAALIPVPDRIKPSQPILRHVNISSNHFVQVKSKTRKLFKQIPILQECPEWILDSSELEAEIYLRRLSEMSSTVFERRGFTQDKYFAMIPLIWTTASNICGTKMSCSFLFEMMVISFLNFQVDEFMESRIGQLKEDELVLVEEFIQNILFHENETQAQLGAPMLQQKAPLQAIIANLERFKDHVMKHSLVLKSSMSSRHYLKTELRKFLLAHMVQNRDNKEIFKSQRSGQAAHMYYERSKDFKYWLRGTASAHTSCIYSFAFARCLVEGDADDPFPGIEERYIADDLVQHLATMCRLQNDFGSLARDRTECNLNCADFQELCDISLHDREEKSKARMLALADHERTLMTTCMNQLTNRCTDQACDMLNIFVKVTEIFGQIYIIKDMASRRLDR